MQHISRTSSFLPCPEVISLFMAKLDMAKHLGMQKRNAKLYFKRHKKNLHSQLDIFVISSFSIIDKSLQLIRNAGSITKTHSHSRLLGDLENCAQLWQFGQKKKKKVGNRICFGNSNAVVFWEIGLVSSLKGYFHLAHQLLLRSFYQQHAVH